MESRKQFTFYRSYYQALMQLPKCHRLRLVEAILAYGLDGTEPKDLNGVQTAAFILIRPTLDRAWKLAKGGSLGGSKSGSRKPEPSEAEAFGKPGTSLHQGTGNPLSRECETEVENEKEFECETESETSDPGVAGFERFWDLYPLKVGREAALEAYREVRPDDETLCRNLNFWLSSRQWKKENGRFIPRAAKFLRERHFDHVPPDCVPTGGTGYMGKAELEAIERILKD